MNDKTRLRASVGALVLRLSLLLLILYVFSLIVVNLYFNFFSNEKTSVDLGNLSPSYAEQNKGILNLDGSALEGDNVLSADSTKGEQQDAGLSTDQQSESSNPAAVNKSLADEKIEVTQNAAEIEVASIEVPSVDKTEEDKSASATSLGDQTSNSEQVQTVSAGAISSSEENAPQEEINIDQMDKLPDVGKNSKEGSGVQLEIPTNEAHSTAEVDKHPPTSLNDNSEHVSDEWLFKQNSKNFTLQLATFETKQDAENFFRLKGLSSRDDEAYMFVTSPRNQKQFHYILVGSFAQDDKRVETLKKNLNARSAWTRSIGIIQEKRCLGWKRLNNQTKLDMFCG